MKRGTLHLSHLVVFLFAAVLLFPGRSRATVVVHRTLDQMIADASHILWGRVLSVRPFVHPDNKYIYREVLIKPKEWLKNPLNLNVVRLYVLGGTVGNITTAVPGTASYKRGEEVVLFLEKRRSGGHFFTLGMAAGKYSVITKGGKKYLYRKTQGLAFYLQGQKNPISELNLSEKPLTLKFLREKISSIVRKTPKYQVVSTEKILQIVRLFSSFFKKNAKVTFLPEASPFRKIEANKPSSPFKVIDSEKREKSK